MKAFIGWDSREELAFQVCERSLRLNATVPLDVWPLKQNELRERNLYWREQDPLSSTEFSFTRFLVPYLTGYSGWALFCDCDFLFRRNIKALQDYCDPNVAVYVVKHNYQPTETHKMDGCVQTQYPRKNWSSFMWMNCGHPAMQALTLDVVNNQSGLYLHRFEWLNDEYIGELPVKFNYLEGWYTQDDEPDPLAVHFTRGGPWFKEWVDVEYGQDWIDIAKGVRHD